jgi:hypothetical protein
MILLNEVEFVVKNRIVLILPLVSSTTKLFIHQQIVASVPPQPTSIPQKSCFFQRAGLLRREAGEQ